MRASRRALALSEAKELDGADDRGRVFALAMACGIALASIPSEERRQIDKDARAAARRLTKAFAADDPDDPDGVTQEEAEEFERALAEERAQPEQPEPAPQVEPAGRRRAREAQQPAAA